ncbi:hypothetical protein [Spirosoma endophyticum]|uniref:Uncharacterized protein n=1 Tax=Spirosoma endophyticum TaxID=662367 RepID=A0A1I2HWV9_9BACT|nr:hypothetical protein [Spirosoma endophyticum]SFF33860.1 hypothetical protein SAMN05216167_1504 [Spirosoma endophyticum]
MNFTKQPVQPVINSLHYTEWIIKDFKVLFLLSERILTEIRKISLVDNWYEDPIASATYIDRVNTCFISVRQYHKAFGILPQVGDRLYNEDTGMIVQDRSIDGGLMTITFTLSL